MQTQQVVLNDINFMGESKIIGPDGIDLVNAEQGEKLICAEINTDDILLVREKITLSQMIQENSIDLNFRLCKSKIKLTSLA